MSDNVFVKLKHKNQLYKNRVWENNHRYTSLNFKTNYDACMYENVCGNGVI